jgi:hypothetical protein
MSFDINVETVAIKFQMEIADFKCDMNQRNMFWHVGLFDFYKLFSPDKIPSA